MRPLRLSVEGLTCFRDRQEIDFEALELFAISGPTGAGKSTLLDAMTFALYGEVPRVHHRSRTQLISSARERLSVELEFAVGGERHRVARSLRRNGSHHVVLERSQGAGAAGADSGVALVERRILQVLGLSADAFLQAVVLPQGQFARFLKAAPKERRDMVRSLLRLDVYERMRQEAQHTASTKRVWVEAVSRLLAEEYGGVDEVALAELEARHEQAASRLEGLRAQREAAQRGLDAMRARHEKTRELSACEVRLSGLEAQAEAVERGSAALMAARRAAPLLPLIAEAARAEEARERARQRAEDAARERRAAEEALEAAAREAAAAEEIAAQLPELRARWARLHRALGTLLELQRLEATIARLESQAAGLEEDLAELAAAIEAAGAAREAQEAARAAARVALQEAPWDAERFELIESVRQRAAMLAAHRQRAEAAARDLEAERRARSELEARLPALEAAAKEALEAAAAGAEEVQRARDAALGAHRRDVAHVLRASLAPNEPCPVCEQLVAAPPLLSPAPEEGPAKKALEAAERRKKAAEAKAREASAELSRTLARLREAEAGVAAAETSLGRSAQAIAAAESELRAALPQEVGGEVKPEAWVEAQAAELAGARRRHEAARGALVDAERALERAAREDAAAMERRAEKSAALLRLSGEIEEHRRRCGLLEAEVRAATELGAPREAPGGASDAEALHSRDTAAGEQGPPSAPCAPPTRRDPAAEAAALAERIEAIEETRRGTAAALAGARGRSGAAVDAEASAGRAAEEAAVRATERVGARDLALETAGFAGAEAARAALLDEATAAQLEAEVRRHEQELHAASERIDELEAELEGERVPAEAVAAAEERSRSFDAAIEAESGALGALLDQVAEMRRRLARSQQKREKLKAEAQRLRVHERLAADLRSEGFQAYVLEETFTELVAGASARLLRLTSERYALHFDRGDIFVVDHDNAGERRISETLSGGETFLASLALALELSAQVQRAAGAVQLESLFIDEGFGTLDPDALALVTETLQSLGIGGRMVGVITHLPELRDEFAQQIIVSKHLGFSTVEVRGAGD